MTDADWNRTEILVRRLDDEVENIAGKLQYKGRHIIHRDTPIDGGVCLGGAGREAIVIDTVLYHDYPVNELYEHIKPSLSRKRNTSENLQTIFDTVKEHMIYSDKGVKKIIKERNLEKDNKIQLDVFLSKGVGVCRHMALLGGIFAEKAVEDGFIEGNVSYDRNGLAYVGAHGWTRFTTPDSEVYILDPAQLNRVLTLNQAVKQGKWAYQREEDKINVQEKADDIKERFYLSLLRKSPLHRLF